MAKRSAPDLGKTLQTLRKSKGLTLDKLASMSGVSKSMLSQIERGQTNPTFATLWGLTQALGVEISKILEQVDQQDTQPLIIEHLQAHFTPTIQNAEGTCSLKILSPAQSVAALEWYEMRLSPQGALHSAPHSAGTEEHLTILSGQATVRVNDTVQALTAGETLRYRADVPHAITNDGGEETIALLVVSTPQ